MLDWVGFYTQQVFCIAKINYFVEELRYVTCGKRVGTGEIFISNYDMHISHTHAHTYIRLLFITKWQEILPSPFSMCDLVRYQRPIKGESRTICLFLASQFKMIILSASEILNLLQGIMVLSPLIQKFHMDTFCKIILVVDQFIMPTLVPGWNKELNVARQ